MSAPAPAARTPNPRALAVWCAAALTSSLVTTNPIHRAAILLAALNVCIALARPGTHLGRLAAGVGVAGLIAVVINALTSHSGAHVLVSLPPIPGIGGPVTLEAVVYGVTIAAAIAAATLSTVPLALALDPDDLVDALPRRLERTGAAVGSALAALPRLVRTASALHDTQRTRGWRDTRREPLRAILVPALLTAIEDSVQLAEAMEARGFGSGPRTAWRAQPWRRHDLLVVVTAAAAAALALSARLHGLLPDWYPYPALSAPPFPAVTVAIVVLLLVPVLAWRPR